MSLVESLPRFLASFKRFLNWEIGASILVLLAALVCAWPELRGMATSSLWQDELYSIEHYSSKGPLFTMTHYTFANNHIFFNLLNSITPGTKRFEPLRARFWSFIFLSLTVSVILISQISAGRPFQGSLQLFLLLANLPLLDLLLQARGYGFLAFAAISCTVLTWIYFRKPSPLPLIGLPVVIWLGTWTVPTFGLFGAALLLTLLLYTRDWRWLPAGGCTFAAILLVYWPVRASFLEIARTYAFVWGKEFGDWNAVGDVLSTYFLFGAASWFTLLVSALLIVGVSCHFSRSAEDRASLCVGLSVLITFIACLAMETAARRTVAYTVIPLAFVAVTLYGHFFRRLAFPSLRIFVTTTLVLAALAFSAHLHSTFRFLPIEAWRETARQIETRFPKATEVVARFRPQWLQVYLSPNYPMTGRFDLAKFRSGRQIVVDSSFPLAQENASQAAKARFPISLLPPGYRTETVPQRRGGAQKIYFSGFIRGDSPASVGGADEPAPRR
jgi:hypothetical protein